MLIWRGLHYRRANLKGAKLDFAFLWYADLEEAYLRNADLDGSLFGGC